MSERPRLSPEDFDAAIAEKDHARDVGDDHKVAKFWEAELDALHDNPSLADGGVATRAQLEARERQDAEFREALTIRCTALLRGCGFKQIRIGADYVADPTGDVGWRELKYVVQAFDTEDRRYDLDLERPSRPNLGIEYTRDFLFELADQIAAQLILARDAYILRMVSRPVAEVASA